MKKIITSVLALSMLAFGLTAVAAGNPSGSGQPNQTCVTTISAANEPGNAGSARGSAFNENGGIAGAVYAGNGISGTKANSDQAVSQYDVACFQVTSNLSN